MPHTQIPYKRLAGTLALSMFALFCAALSPTAAQRLCAAAMLLSSAGDILLMGFSPVTRRFPHPFEAGAVCFMLAHLVYAAVFLMRAGFPAPNGGTWAGAAVCAAAFAVLVGMFFRGGKKSGAMLALGAAYVLIIGGNITAVFTAAAAAGGAVRLSAAGAVLFFLSDTLIGADRLAGQRPRHMDGIIWTLYPAGQIFLIAGCLH